MNLFHTTRSRPMATPIPGLYEARARERAEREAALARKRQLLEDAMRQQAPTPRKRKRGSKVDTVSPTRTKRVEVAGVLEFHGRVDRRDPHGTEMMTCYQALVTTVDGRSKVLIGSVNDLGRALTGSVVGHYVEITATVTADGDMENYTLK